MDNLWIIFLLQDRIIKYKKIQVVSLAHNFKIGTVSTYMGWLFG